MVAPVLTSLNPSTKAVGGGSFTLHVIGTGFVSGGQIVFNTVTATTYVSATELTATVDLSQFIAGEYLCRVMQAGEWSNALSFTATEVAHELNPHCFNMCNVAPDCALPSPWPPAPAAGAATASARK